MAENPPADRGGGDEPMPRSEADAGPGDGYGQAPPPSSAYPTPEQGGFPPPSAPGPGAAGYGPPGPGYGDAPHAEPQATDSLSRGWRAFTANPWPFVVSQLLWALIFIIPVLLLLAAFGVFASPRVNADGSVDGSAGLAVLFGIGGLTVVVVVMLLAIVQFGGFATASLRAIAGERVGVADFFKPRHFGQLIVLAILVAIASGILAITGIGPLIVMFFGIWAVFFIIDRGQSAIDAIGSSVRFAIGNAGQTIVLVLLGYLLNFVGALLCGVGTLISNPVTMLAFADYYRRRTGPGTPGAPIPG